MTTVASDETKNALINSANIDRLIRRGGIQSALENPGRVQPACPVVSRKRTTRETSKRVAFSKPEIVDVDPDDCSYPMTKGYSCKNSQSEKGDSCFNAWRSDKVDAYIESGEEGTKRRLEVFLATAHALRKARELQQDLRGT